MAEGRSLLSRFRASLKRFVYSGPRRDRWQHPDEVLARLGLEPGRRVVDLGAGGGYFTFKLARAVGPEGLVFAVDPDDDMRAWIDDRAADKGYPQITTVAPRDGRIDVLGPVDAVLTVNAFHHFPQERVNYLAGLARVLRPGARVAVIESRPRWYLFGHHTHADEIRTVMEAAGYAFTEEHDLLERQSFTIFERAADGPTART